ncbi:hypothetical protein MBRA1_001503 [Malassezia brasiliensis]|uniref:Uncharacterized protein n=1 Tax=Malassezia brasiliensis TaxID=1821822 RepID=A0AAF0DRL8_9BASI|nr:hypothetical protein MBRA1_001503 [Malassezia brasiliensis]
MTSRNRASFSGSSEELQVWQTVRSQLKSLENARNASLSGYERLVRAQSESPTKNLEGIYNVVESCILDEQRAISGALEQIDVLVALRQASMDGSSDVRRRKRKADDSLADFADSAADVKGKLTADTRRTRTASSSFSKRGSEADARLAQISAQLPLQRGRKVAFCQPQKNDVYPGEEGEVWIMATVISCINNDTHRYIVQDAEDEGNNGPCFYNATIQGGGPNISSATSRSKKREAEFLQTPYQLMFDDDGSDIKQQQLLNESQAQKKKNNKRPQEKRTPKPKPDNAKSKPKEADSAAPTSALTWQQELFRQSQRPAAFDYAADSRDVETFGEGKGRATAGASTPDRRKNKAKTRAEPKSPSTPNKKMAAVVAYAGPTFHNSPAATSLPAPKFGGKSKIPNADDARAVSDAAVPAPVSTSAVPETVGKDAENVGADTSSMSLPPNVTAPERATAPSSVLSPPLTRLVPARVTTSSLQYLEEPGSVALVPAQAESSSRAWADGHGTRLAWQVHGRAAKPDPILVAGPESIQAASFLRRYHPGIHVPSRLLASMILDDDQTKIRKEDNGADLTKCTTTTLALEHTASILVVCVGGANRDELFVSEFRSDGRVYTSGDAAWKARGPIVQVQSTAHHTLLVRTRIATVVGDVRRTEGEHEGTPMFRFYPTQKLKHTNSACADACLASETCAYTTDTQGIVQAWDVVSNKVRRKTKVGHDEHDAFWALGIAGHTLDVASCYTLASLDLRHNRLLVTYGILEQTVRGALWMRLLRTSPSESWPSLNTEWSSHAHQRARDASDTEDAGPFGDAEMTPVDYRQLYQAGILGYLGTDNLATWEASTSSRLDALTQEPKGTASETLLDLLAKQGPHYAGASEIHTDQTLCAHTAEPAQVARIFQHAQDSEARNQLAVGLPWLRTVPTDAASLWPWLTDKLSDSDAPVVRDAASQMALDVLLASYFYPGSEPAPIDAHNTNWRWDRRGPPVCPPAPELSLVPKNVVHTSPLSDTARLLLSEWPDGEDAARFTYRNPYRGLDFGHTEEEVRVSASQPVRPTVVAAQKPRVVSRRPHPEVERASSPIPMRFSQEASAPSSSQDAEEPPKIPQTQIEPGRFGQRAVPKPPKRKKRMGGF